MPIPNARRTWLIAAGVTLAILVLSFVWWRYGSKNNAFCYRCNIVVVMVDNLRADALPCYGYKLPTAPNICRFAKKSIVFDRAFANSSWTLPSVMSFFTSLYPTGHDLGVTLLNTLNPAIVTLPSLLMQNGYHTAFISTNQPSVGLNQGLRSGFSSVTITPTELDTSLPLWLDSITAIREANARNQPVFAFFHTDGVHEYPNEFIRMNTFPLDPEYTPPALPRVPFGETTLAHAKARLEEHISLGGGEASVAAYRSWYAHLANARSFAQSETIFRTLPQSDQDYILGNTVFPILSAANPEAAVTLQRHTYDERIRLTDEFLSVFLAELEESGLLERTIVVITSEHGELLGESGLLGHNQKMLNPEIHVPLFVYAPGILPERQSAIIQLIDLYPTLIELVGIPAKGQLHGISFAPTVAGNPQRLFHAFAITEWADNRWQAKTIQDTDWKLFIDTDTRGMRRYELYHILLDPLEQEDVSALYPTVVAYLATAFNEAVNTLPTKRAVAQPFPVWIDEEHRKNLIETGYFNRQ